MTEKEIELLKRYTERGRIKSGEKLIIKHLEKLGLVKIITMGTPSYSGSKQERLQFVVITQDGADYLSALPPEKNWFQKLIDKIFKGGRSESA